MRCCAAGAAGDAAEAGDCRPEVRGAGAGAGQEGESAHPAAGDTGR